VKIKDELTRVFDKYINDALDERRCFNIVFPCNEDGKPTKEDRDFISEFVDGRRTRYASFDKPDGYAIMERFGLIVEHFEIDSYRRNNKGSTFRQALAKQEKGIAKAHFDYHPDLLTDNFRTTYQAHLKKTKSYLENLKQAHPNAIKLKNKKLFVIEDVTDYGYTKKDATKLEIATDMAKKIITCFYNIPSPVAYNFYFTTVNGDPYAFFVSHKAAMSAKKRFSKTTAPPITQVTRITLRPKH